MADATIMTAHLATTRTARITATPKAIIYLRAFVRLFGGFGAFGAGFDLVRGVGFDFVGGFASPTTALTTFGKHWADG